MLLNEGMRPGDLQDLVLPLISIDEYESKIDDNAIVIGFYVSDVDAADDLNRFIQKSPFQFLDTEVSPAPDQKGYYLTFVELMNDAKIVENLEGLIEEIEPLCSNDKWQMRVRDFDNVMPFATGVLKKRFEKLREEQKEKDKEKNEMQESVMRFLTSSDLSSASILNNCLIMEKAHTLIEAELLAFGDAERLMNDYGLENKAVSLEMRDLAYSRHVSNLLGEGWTTCRIGDHALICHADRPEMLLLRKMVIR